MNKQDFLDGKPFYSGLNKGTKALRYFPEGIQFDGVTKTDRAIILSERDNTDSVQFGMVLGVSDTFAEVAFEYFGQTFKTLIHFSQCTLKA
jgi:hypothetical protein